MNINGTKPRILFLEYTDYDNFPIGGQTTFATNFMKESTSELSLVGLGRNGRDVGRWTFVRINDKEIPFFSIFCVNSNPPPIPMRLWFLFLLLRYRTKIFSKQFDFVVIQSPEISRALFHMGVPIIFNMPGGTNPMLASKFSWARNHVFAVSYSHMFIVPLIKKAAAIVTIDTACDELVKSVLVHTVGRVIRSSVAVNTAIFKKLGAKNKLELRQAMAIPSDAAVVVFAGRLEVVKGLELLIESFTIFNKHLNGKGLLYICGDGSQQSRLQRLASESANAGKIAFTGALSHNQLTHYFQAADVFAMASHHEGLPNVILEAMSSGLPVVATDVGGISSVVKDGETGFLTRKRDSVEYAGLLLQAFRLRDSLGERAKKLVQGEYATKVVIGKIEEGIETLMQSNG